MESKINRKYTAAPESLNELMKQGARKNAGLEPRIISKKTTFFSYACKKNQHSNCYALKCTCECHE